MRNLKRALSLALASVMLLGMMVVGSSAANFTDADKINNDEAVAIAAGLGIFDGYEDGSFGPEKVVTRAEAAVVIAKILHGADIDPTNFAGAGKFTDVPAWAEGWVNLTSSLGIIVGYGDGKFGPNDQVTTVQFATMLLKALGYYTADDALGADWALTVTSKATALGLYGDLALAMNEGLTRENVAEMTFNALFAQRVAYDDYRGLYVKANDRNVVVTNGTDDELNTLANNTFGLFAVEGTVVANGMTDVALSATLKSDALTTVVFTEDTDLDQDGEIEYDEGDEYDFEYETGLDMIGHAAKVYYKLNSKDEPVVFTIVDQAVLVAEINYNANESKLAAAANNAGFKKNTILNKEITDYIVNYDMGTKVAADKSNVDALDKLIVISNTSNKEVDYVIAIDQYLDVVADVDTNKNDEVVYTIDQYANADLVYVSEELAEDQFVIVTSIGNNDEIIVVEPAVLESGKLTKIVGSTNEKSKYEVSKITVDGTAYSKSQVSGKWITKNFTQFVDISKQGTVNMVMDNEGKVIGLASKAAAPNYAYVAQYGIQHSTGSLNTSDVLTAHVYFADGTNGIYVVDLDESNFDNNMTYKFGTATNTQVKNELNGSDKKDLDENMKGLYNVVVLSNGKVDIDNLTKDASAEVAAVGNKMIKGHSTLVNGNANVKEGIYTLMNSNDTIYFYVSGEYGNGLSVKVVTGIKNVDTYTNTADAGMREAFYTPIAKSAVTGDRGEIDVMLIEDVIIDGTEVYYYNGKYSVDEVEDGKWTVTYTVYDLETGDAMEVTYDNGGKYYSTSTKAQKVADELDKDNNKDTPNNGFYSIGSSNLKEVALTTKASDGTSGIGANVVYYVVNDITLYDEYTENLLTEHFGIGSISEKTLVVDLADSGLTTVKKIVKAVEKNESVKLSYMVNKNKTVDVLFVNSYAPEATVESPIESVADTSIAKVEWAGTAAKVTLKGDLAKDKKVTVDLYNYSVWAAKWDKVASKTMTIYADANDTNADVGTSAAFVLVPDVQYKLVVGGVESDIILGAQGA